MSSFPFCSFLYTEALKTILYDVIPLGGSRLAGLLLVTTIVKHFENNLFRLPAAELSAIVFDRLGFRVKRGKGTYHLCSHFLILRRLFD